MKWTDNGAEKSKILNITNNAVSYTHLDVYKRQIFDN